MAGPQFEWESNLLPANEIKILFDHCPIEDQVICNTDMCEGWLY